MTTLNQIDHFFVLMLENRSFDHLFGSEPNLQDHPLDGHETCPDDPKSPQTQVPVTLDAPDRASLDPPHEFHDVALQLMGVVADHYAADSKLLMNGFAASASFGPQFGESEYRKQRLSAARARGEYALQCHGNGSVGILRTLAREFAVCDQWYCSMPGPTWPNRFFVHAATSGGLDNSPSAPRATGAVIIDKLGFDFKNGTIFDRLADSDWRVYHGDTFPQVLAIKDLVRRFVDGGRETHFFQMSRFAADLKGTYTPRYTFIEPNQDVLGHFRRGDSQHPIGTINAGERLIKQVYEAIRNSPHWAKSALIVTYDEHGGFYDRLPPPEAPPPGDDAHNRKKAQHPARFNFKRLGPRVPTVIVSPLVERGTRDSRVYDHSSILRTLEMRFELSALTGRDAAANAFDVVFTRTLPREDAPEHLPDLVELPEEASTAAAIADAVMEDPSESNEPLNGDEAGVVRIAMCVDHLLNRREATFLRRASDPIVARTLPGLALTPVPEITTRGQARAYVAQVSARLEATRPSVK